MGRTSRATILAGTRRSKKVGILEFVGLATIFQESHLWAAAAGAPGWTACIAQNLSIYCPKAIQISQRNAKFGNQLYLDCKIEEGDAPDQISPPFHPWLGNSLNKGFYPLALLNVINAGCAKSIWRVSCPERTGVAIGGKSNWFQGWWFKFGRKVNSMPPIMELVVIRHNVDHSRTHSIYSENQI